MGDICAGASWSAPPVFVPFYRVNIQAQLVLLCCLLLSLVQAIKSSVPWEPLGESYPFKTTVVSEILEQIVGYECDCGSGKLKDGITILVAQNTLRLLRYEDGLEIIPTFIVTA